MLEKFEKMLKENTFSFRSEAEIAVFELHYPDVLKNNPEANMAARALFEQALTSARKKLSEVSRDTIDAMSIVCVHEDLTAILGIEKWLEIHPALTMESEETNETQENLERALAHAKKSFLRNLQAVPGSIAFEASNENLRKIAEIEQKLGMYPAI